MKPEFYLTDILLWLFFILTCILYYLKRKSPLINDIKRTLLQKSRYVVASLIILSFTVIGLLDSIHFQIEHESFKNTMSVLDLILSPRSYQREKTYSAPFALYGFDKELKKNEAGIVREFYEPLLYAGNNLNNKQEEAKDIGFRLFKGMMVAAGLWVILYFMFKKWLQKKLLKYASNTSTTKSAFWSTIFGILLFCSLSATLMFEYHIFGTDKIGRDVYYLVLKSIRTGLVIGTVTSLVMLPFALFLGVWAGYYRGWVDDIIQYLYTTLGSIPGVLLIAAAVLSFQIKIEESPDLKLVLLCVILGATGWIGLCRLLRGETFKLRETDYVLASRSLGVKNAKILFSHVLPNLMHIVIISVVLDFSGLVLAEAVLSYVGVGVAPTTHSFGNLINAARLELAREPVIWWSLMAAFLFMFTLVFAANILGDAFQQALNPKEQ